MLYNKYLIIILFVFLRTQPSFAQIPDSTQLPSTFSGTVGITNNGFSIIPSFSLNSPALVTTLSFRKNRFSFDPDIRMALNAKNGGFIWWFRYRIVDNKKFGLRVGTHPAFTLVKRNITENNKTTQITEMLRFVAFEAVPSYQFSKKIGASLMYLQGHGLQSHGPQLTKVLFLNTAFTNLNLSENLRLNVFPTVFFLDTDGYIGKYFSSTVALGHNKLPWSIQTTINQTIDSNVPGNKDFMWNITLNYGFSRKVVRK